MKTIKPTKLGLLTKVFEHRHQPYLVASAIVCFPFDAPRRPLLEALAWKLAGEEMGKDAILDELMTKPRGELLVTGRCFVPGGVARPASSVRVQLGSIDKTLYIVGDRHWGPLGASDPEPFTEMPIRYSHAFGGEGFAHNPLGKGAAAIRDEAGKSHHPLPNVEDPRELIKAPGDHPSPAGFEGYDLMWPQRASKAGTYDEAWLKNDFPGLARDLDMGYFNVAPADQQLEGYFQGDESFVIENMHPDEPRIEGTLPGFVVRCFITQKKTSGEELREAVMRLDTIRLFPHRKKGILIYRGVLAIDEDDAGDVLHVLAGCEAIGEPKPIEHYRKVLAQRLDKKTRHLHVMRDKDLMPAPDPATASLPDERVGDIGRLLKHEGYTKKNMARKEERALEDARTRLRAAGIDPDEHMPPRPTARKAPPLDELPEFLAELDAEVAGLKAKAERERREAEERARATCEKHGIDYAAAVAKAQKEAAGPPKFSADREIERLRDMQDLAKNGGVPMPELDEKLASPDLASQLRAAEAQVRSSYRNFAHYMPAASRLEGDEAVRLRDEVVTAHRAGISLAGRDLTGADLSHLDLRGVDLEGAMLEAAALTGADLRGAKLSRAVFARADLSGADLLEADVAGANFGSAKLVDAKARGVDLTKAVLTKANLSGADLRAACLTRADVREAVFADADLGGATGTQILFIRADLQSATLAGVRFDRCVFYEVDVSGVDFAGADLGRCVFIASRGDGAILRDGKLKKLRVVHGSSFAGADFRGACLEQANLLGTRLAGADFTGADLTRTVLNGCDLTGATLDRAVAVSAVLTRTNLTEASLFAVDFMNALLQKANLSSADLAKVNLFGADASRIVGNDETSLAGANVKRVRFVAARRPDEQG